MAAEITIAREARVRTLNSVSSRTRAYGSNVSQAIWNRAQALSQRAMNPNDVYGSVNRIARVSRAANNMIARQETGQRKTQSEDERYLAQHKNASFVAKVTVGRNGIPRYFTSRREYESYRRKAWSSGFDMQTSILKG